MAQTVYDDDAVVVYVQRRNGVIVGVNCAPSSLTDGTPVTDPEPVFADDPEVVAFLGASPVKALALAAAIFLAPASALAQSQPAHWDVRMAIIEMGAAQTGTGKTVLLGDSITEGFYWSTFNNNNCLLINAGFGGIRIKQLADRAAQVMALAQPAALHVMVGTNNLYISQSSPEWADIPADLHKITLAAAPYGAKIVWWPVPPMMQVGAPATYLANRAALNTIIQNEAGATGALWDWWFPTTITDQSGYAAAGSMRPDGVHFSASTQSARYARIGVWSQQPGMVC